MMRLQMIPQISVVYNNVCLSYYIFVMDLSHIFPVSSWWNCFYLEHSQDGEKEKKSYAQVDQWFKGLLKLLVECDYGSRVQFH